MELQELVARARIIFQGAPKRVQVFELVNGKRSAKEIARRSRKSLSAALQDLQKMRDMELVGYPSQYNNVKYIRDEIGKTANRFISIAKNKAFNLTDNFKKRIIG